MQELTPIENACEAMENVSAELRDSIELYRSDGARNLKPFTMRLTGTIDANVMGGIKKYQDAFFSEQFAESADGRAEKATIKRLKTLMLEQVELLDTALELHGTLAPADVQPLQRRLLEQLEEMKKSVLCMDRTKRQFSLSIRNTPLPPVPVEKRSMSLNIAPAHDMTDDVVDDHSNYYMMSFEKEDIYMRLDRVNGTSTPHAKPVQRTMSARDKSISITSDDAPASAPPVPIRPKSTGYGNYDSPEIPPKCNKDIYGNISSAPPLPPRGLTPDTRHRSNPMLSNSSHSLSHDNDLHTACTKTPQYSVCVNIPIEDHPEADRVIAEQYRYERVPQIEHRDSGISTASQDLNYVYICGDLTQSPAVTTTTTTTSTDNHNQVNANDSVDSNANENEREYASTPPPIPRKMTNSLNFSVSQSNSEIFTNENGIETNGRNSNQSLAGNDTVEADIDGYTMPKICNLNNHWKAHRCQVKEQFLCLYSWNRNPDVGYFGFIWNTSTISLSKIDILLEISRRPLHRKMNSNDAIHLPYHYTILEPLTTI